MAKKYVGDKTTTSVGLYAYMNSISEDEIKKITDKYKLAHPQDKRTDEELRPYAINEIIKKR